MSKFKKVYFRINTPSYYRASYGVGFENQEASEKFDQEVLSIFVNDGWELKKEKYGGGCSRVIKDKQELYLHPQSFSGVVVEDNIPAIEKLISNNKLFKFERTDIYEEVFDITDEEYLNILESKRKEIENDLLEVYKTKRSNLYITGCSPISRVLDKYRIKRLSHYVGVYSSSNKDYQYVLELFDELVKENRIVTAKTKSGTGYRTDKTLLPKVKKTKTA